MVRAWWSRAALIVALHGLFPGGLRAQSTSKLETTPPGFVSSAGSGWNYYLGAYQAGRLQHGDGDLTGQAISISQLDLRADEARIYDAAQGMGRTWTRLTLDLGKTDVGRFGSAWTANFLASPSNVFAGKLTLPTLSGVQATPQWGLATIPFQKAFAYDGKNHICYDFVFDGGTLANGSGWGTSFVPYYLDGVVSAESVPEASSRYLPASPFAGSNTCNDSAITSTIGAYALHQVDVYADNHTTTSLRAMVSLRASTFRTAPGATVIALLTYGGTDQGLALSAGCNRLFVDPLRLIARTSAVTDKTDAAWSGYLFPNTPQVYPKILFGVSTWLQAGWNDSKTGRFSLTTANQIVLPKVPTLYTRATVYRPGPPAATGFLLPASTWWGHVHVRLSFQ